MLVPSGPVHDARDQYTADMLHKHSNPSVHTSAPAHHGTAYAEPHTHMRAHVVRTRGVCAKPRRHAGAVTPQGSHLSAARHRVALSLYQSYDRDLLSMLEAEPAPRRGHQCLHWSSPHKLMLPWSERGRRTASIRSTLILCTADEYRTHGASI